MLDIICFYFVMLLRFYYNSSDNFQVIITKFLNKINKTLLLKIEINVNRFKPNI